MHQLPLNNNHVYAWGFRGVGIMAFLRHKKKTPKEKRSLIQSHLLSYLVLFNAGSFFTLLLIELQLFRSPSRLWACFELSLHLEPSAYPFRLE